MDASSLPLPSFYSSFPKKEVYFVIIVTVGIRNGKGTNKHWFCEEGNSGIKLAGKLFRVFYPLPVVLIIKSID